MLRRHYKLYRFGRGAGSANRWRARRLFYPFDRQASGQAARVFGDFMWSTKDSWTRRRRVVGKAEWTLLGANPRFVVTSLEPERWAARALYEDLYCARGDMENRIKECQLDLYADRTSARTMHANQLRLWFASLAYVLICALRRLDSVACSQNCSAQPAYARDQMVFTMQTAHVFLRITPSSLVASATVLEIVPYLRTFSWRSSRSCSGFVGIDRQNIVDGDDFWRAVSPDRMKLYPNTVERVQLARCS
jgi:hypothetical protein